MTTTPSGAAAGIHHITAITGNGRENIRFYRDVLGLRLVKRTVNFDDPGAHHLYFGDAAGRPGTILTFFAWAGAHRGKPGTGEAQTIAFRVPRQSLGWWRSHLEGLRIACTAGSRFGEEHIGLSDPDGIGLELVAAGGADPDAWSGSVVPQVHAIAGFHGVTLHVEGGEGTAQVLSGVLGFAETAQDGEVRRFSTGTDRIGGHVDVIVDARRNQPAMGTGSIHHVAFRAADDAMQAAMAEALQAIRIGTTEQKDRTYFRSVYFREPGGVIFEIATDEPGFAIDESPETLGTALKLPPQYEAQRRKIEAALPDID
jgi:glyoxalase family protein